MSALARLPERLRLVAAAQLRFPVMLAVRHSPSLVFVRGQLRTGLVAVVYILDAVTYPTIFGQVRLAGRCGIWRCEKGEVLF